MLVYYSTENVLCQAFFETFFDFFCIFIFCYLFTRVFNVYRYLFFFYTIYSFFLYCLFSRLCIFFTSLQIIFIEVIYERKFLMEYIRQLNPFYKMMSFTIIMFLISGIISSIPSDSNAVIAYSQKGSQGSEVEAVQQTLKDRGLFNAEVTGYFGEKTEQAILRFQKQQGLAQTGVADQATLKRLGITIGSIPPATEANINLLARIISAEGRGEPYIGQVAIGAVIMNRIEHPSFPDTLAGIIYENGAFTALVDGQFNEPIADSAYDAARDALSGWDPTGGCIYYYNPKKTSNQFMMSRPVQKVIGDHYFCT